MTFGENVDLLNEFTGKIHYETEFGDIQEVDLDISNFVPRSSRLKHTSDMIGLVLYTGHDTKVMRNTKLRKFKISSIEKKLSRYVFVIIVIMLFVLVGIGLYSVLIRKNHVDFILLYLPKDHEYGVEWLIVFLAYFLVLNTVLPISLVVSLNISRLF